MEKESRIERAKASPVPDFVLKWGNRKRPRCMKTRDEDASEKPEASARKKGSSRFDADKEALSPQSNLINRNGETAVTIGSCLSDNSKPPVPSPEKEDRYYATRASGYDDSSDAFNEKSFVWPKFFVSLSCKEKEEDFMAMKGCKLPQRPKKRAKIIQKGIHLVCPGTWLSELSLERYEVREKKCSKKKVRGLKALGNMDSDSE